MLLLRGVGVSLRAFFGAAIIPFVSCVPMLIALTIATIYVENPFVCLGISFALALIYMLRRWHIGVVIHSNLRTSMKRWHPSYLHAQIEKEERIL